MDIIGIAKLHFKFGAGGGTWGRGNGYAIGKVGCTIICVQNWITATELENGQEWPDLYGYEYG